MPAGLSLEELKVRFQTIPNVTELVARRLAYIYAILFDPERILSYIDDEVLLGQVEADRLKDSTALFLCVAPVETALDEKVFSGRPDNSIRAHLRREFRKQDWPWPAYPMDWKRYFMEYHMDTLFEDISENVPGATDQT